VGLITDNINMHPVLSCKVFVLFSETRKMRSKRMRLENIEEI